MTLWNRRINRLQFVLGWLSIYLVYNVFLWIVHNTLPTAISASAMVFLYVAGITASFLLFSLRLHDLGYSGWWSLVALIPIINIVFLIYLLFTKGNSVNNT